MADTELCYRSATEAIAAFRARSLSPVELVRAVINRADRVNPKVNALAATCFEHSLAQARRAEARYGRRGARPRRLEGVPLTVKDDHAVKGQVTTHGSRLFEHSVDTTTTLVVERLLRAGAIMIGRSTTPEFAASTVCHSPLWGITRNPWNLAFSPGGSTGGGACAVASGMTTLSDGADHAGSIRIPAACCGVFGFKPPTGRNPAGAPWNLNDFSVFGPITRSVADAALMQNVMSGPHPADITSLRRRLRLPPAFAPVRGFRVAVSPDLGFFEVEPEVLRNLEDSVRTLRALGCEVERVDLGWTEEVLHAFYVHGHEWDLSPVSELPPEERAQIADYLEIPDALRRLIARYRYADTFRVRAAMWERLGPILERCELLVCPTLAVSGVAAEHDINSPDFRINGRPAAADLGWCMTFPFNMLPQLPVATVPNGFGRDGLPTALQIVGRPFDDLGVFRTAADCERARPWSGRRPAIR